MEDTYSGPSVTCPQCKVPFELVWDNTDYRGVQQGKSTLHVRSCESSGVYGVSVECPNCDYREEV